MGAANWNPLSLTLSPLLRRGERESTSGMVVVSSCARPAFGVLKKIDVKMHVWQNLGDNSI